MLILPIFDTRHLFQLFKNCQWVELSCMWKELRSLFWLTLFGWWQLVLLTFIHALQCIANANVKHEPEDIIPSVYSFLHCSYGVGTVWCQQVACSSICTSGYKCMIMYYKQMAGPRTVNFCRHMHVDKIPSHANFQPHRRRTWPSFSRSNNRIESIEKFKHDYLANIAIANT